MSSPQRREREETKKNDAITQQVVDRMKSDWPKFSDNILSSPSHQSHLTELLLGNHDMPHKHASIEWWYINGHVQNPTDPTADMSFFAAFFRIHNFPPSKLKAEADTTPADRDAIIGNVGTDRLSALTWAVTHHNDKTYRPFGFVDEKTPKAMLEAMKCGLWHGNAHVKESLAEVFRKTSVPAPDKIFSKPVVCNPDKLEVDMEGCVFKEIDSPTNSSGKKKYQLHLEGTDDKGSIAIDCVIEPTKCPLLHGENGIVAIDHNLEGPEDMFYYFVPRCKFEGSFSTNNGPRKSISGLSWYDHEFGTGYATSKEELQAAVVIPQQKRGGKEFSWEWAAIQLTEGADMEVSAVRLTTGDTLLDFFVIVREGNDAANPQYRLENKDLEFFPIDEAGSGFKYTSPRTSLTFNTKWRLKFKSRVTGGDVDLILHANTIDQEFETLMAMPAFWEGHMEVNGTWNNVTVKGAGYLECRGATGGSAETLFDFLHSIFCLPLRDAAKSIHPKPGCNGADGYIGYISEEVDKSLAMSPPETAAQFNNDPELKKLLVAIACAYLHLIKSGKNSRGVTLDWLEDQFLAHPSKMKSPSFHLILFRAFALRQVDIATGIIPDLLAGNNNSNNNDNNEDAAEQQRTGSGVRSEMSLQNGITPRTAESEEAVLERATKILRFPVTRFTVPDDVTMACNTPPSDETIATCKKLFTGQWELSRERSESMSNVMAAQGVNVFVRGITDRLTPVLNTKIEKDASSATNVVKIISDVKTAVNTSVSTTITGVNHKWFSQGRGELVSDSCLQDGGRTLYSRTFVPPSQRKAVEHKWMRVEEEFDDADQKTIRRFIEFYRYDPDGVKNDATSAYACRLFLTKKE